MALDIAGVKKLIYLMFNIGEYPQKLKVTRVISVYKSRNKNITSSEVTTDWFLFYKLHHKMWEKIATVLFSDQKKSFTNYR